MKHLIIFILCSLFFATGCKPKQQLTDTTVSSQSELIMQHDKLTPVALPVDSFRVRALFECDSTNKVVLKELNEIKSRNIQSAFDWHDGLLDVSIRTGGDTVYIPGTDFYWRITNYHKRTITLQKTVHVEKKLSLLQKIQIISGNIFLLIISILIIYFIVKNAIKLKTN